MLLTNRLASLLGLPNEDDVFNVFAGAEGAVHAFPAINLWHRNGVALLTAQMPGMTTQDIEVSVKANSITLKGCRKMEKRAKGADVLRNETHAGAFERKIALPFRVNTAAVEAKMRNGTLFIKLPCATESKGRKISVK